jgi:3-deoxy-D-manno-octulosonic acid kinase
MAIDEIPGFTRLDAGSRTCFVRPAWRDALPPALWEGAGEPMQAPGRGGLRRVAGPGGGAAVVRALRRGGLVRHVLRDRFVADNRPLAELLIHLRAYEAGLPVPEPLGAAWERRGLLYRGAIATREVDGVPLRIHLEQRPDAVEACFEALGEVVHRLHETGIFHGDLQVENVLVTPDGALYLIDFDKSRANDALSTTDRARNLLRLRRSMERHGIGRDAFRALLKGYGPVPVPRWLDTAYRLRGLGRSRRPVRRASRGSTHVR